MTMELSPAIRARRAVTSMVTLLGGVTLAVIPAATVAIGARLFGEDEQGLLAVAVMAATFAGQIAFAIVVESRLSSAATERRVVFPLWLAGLALVAAIVVAANPANPFVISACLPVLVAALEVGRGVSVAERLDRRETVASVAVGAGALAGVLAGMAGHGWAFLPLVAGILAATMVRSLPVEHKASRPQPAAMVWVVTDTAVTGVVYPLLNAMILALVSPADSVRFTAIATVSGLLAIPLNFMRMRLLKEHSRLDVAVSAAAVVGAVAALVVLHLAGLLDALFGGTWTGPVILPALLLACAWRAASLATTLPFAALRRMGEVRLLTALRAGVSALTFALAGVGLVLHSLPAVFLGLLAAELASALVYEVARRRVIARGTGEQVNQGAAA